MSPILVRPVREQLEHDRVIRQLQARWKRKYTVAVNVGSEQTAIVTSGAATLNPDVVLTSLQGGRKIQGIVEVETGESVNSMEALAQWAPMARMRAPFSLYVPSGSVEAARCLCQDNQIEVAEIWGYQTLGDQTRFALVHRGSRQPSAAARRQRVGRPRRTPPARGAQRRPAAASKKPRRAGSSPTRARAPRQGSGRPEPRAKGAKRPKKASRTHRRR